mgnify:CR=1 FL=1
MTIIFHKNFSIYVIFILLSMFFIETKLIADDINYQGSVVKIHGDHRKGFELYKDDKIYEIKGVGGDRNLDLLVELGGNTIRTWGVDANTKNLLDRAEELGLMVTLGLWVEHKRHGFDYTNEEDIYKQRERIFDSVKKFKDHPALLLWGLGNEMEGVIGEGSDQDVWSEVNYLARRIKEIDINHPVMSVVANVNPNKVKAIQKYAPNIDILGINAYAGAAGLASRIKDYDWDKPYALTEFGTPGPWEVPLTEWEAPIEPSSLEKMSHYYSTHQEVSDDKKQCLGTYAFYWGNKQEATASWFGLLLSDGSKLPAADTMGYLWSGDWPKNRSPLLKDFDIPFAFKYTKAEKPYSVRVKYKDPDSDRLSYHWTIFEESNDRRIGGDKEEIPQELIDCIIEQKSNGTAEIKIPSKKGPYRLYVTVRDNYGNAAIDNWPFYVK